jgi:hypothetical protein
LPVRWPPAGGRTRVAGLSTTRRSARASRGIRTVRPSADQVANTGRTFHHALAAATRPDRGFRLAGRNRKLFRRNPLGGPDESPVLPQPYPDPTDVGVSEASTGVSLTACGGSELGVCDIHTCGFPRLSTGPSTGSEGCWGQLVHMLFIHSFHRRFRPQLLNSDVPVRGLGTTCGFLEDSSRNPLVDHGSMHSVHNWPESGDQVGDGLWTQCGQQNLSTAALDSSSSYPLAIHNQTRGVTWGNQRNPQFPQGLLLLLFFI